MANKNIRKLKNQLMIYQSKSGAIELRGDFDRETIWANQTQIVDIFGIDQSVVSRHIHNIFKDNEVDKKSNMQKMHIANSNKLITLPACYKEPLFDFINLFGYNVNYGHRRIK